MQQKLDEIYKVIMEGDRMTITEIEYGSIASSKKLNDNFNALNKDIQDLAESLNTTNANLATSIFTLNKNIAKQIEDIKILITDVFDIGAPQLSLDGILPDNCVWYEGAEVSRETYSLLFEKFGTTYGEGDGSTTFNLPNFVGRVPWGATDYGYIEPGLPNITATWNGGRTNELWAVSGAVYAISTGLGFTGGGSSSGIKWELNASRSSSIYGASPTVQPPALKVRVYGRYQ